MEDDLKPEYNLKSLRVRKQGSGRKDFAGVIVKLESDFAEVLPVTDKEVRSVEEMR